MSGTEVFSDEPEDARERVMRAVFVVLREHGYAGLSIKRIADEVGMQKASIYHHYSDKDDLLFSFLEFVLELFETEFIQQSGMEPEEQLRKLIDRATLGGEATAPECAVESPDAVMDAFMIVRSQALHDDCYRGRITEVDERLREHLAGLVRGATDDARGETETETEAVEHAATSLQTMIAGAFFQRATSEEPDLEPVRQEAHAYLDRQIGTGSDEPSPGGSDRPAPPPED
jgi:AcrR family transcriptional regulator